MNFRAMRDEFDRACRTAQLAEMEDLRDAWLNQGWEKIAETFVMPSLAKTALMDSVANQQNYLFPYDYNGGEMGLRYQRRRLDPIPEENLLLAYEKRTASMGMVRYYDWSGTKGSDLLVVPNCTLVNNSVTVLCTSADPILDVAHWLRFDPYEDANNELIDPGDYGYQILAGSQVPGVSFQLTQAYRGPDGTSFTARVEPSEQQQFRVFGIPAAADVGAFDLRYPSRPRRLWNDSDVPEWPSMGLAIVYMAVSIGLEWHHNMDMATTFWSRAMQKVKGLERRRKRVEALVSDITPGSTVGRHVGLRPVFLGRRYR